MCGLSEGLWDKLKLTSQRYWAIKSKAIVAINIKQLPKISHRLPQPSEWTGRLQHVHFIGNSDSITAQSSLSTSSSSKRIKKSVHASTHRPMDLFSRALNVTSIISSSSYSCLVRRLHKNTLFYVSRRLLSPEGKKLAASLHWSGSHVIEFARTVSNWPN